MPEFHTGYNLGLEFVNCYRKADDLVGQQLEAHLERLEVITENCKHLHTLIQKLTSAKSAKKGDFSKDEDYQKAKAHLLETNPNLLGHGNDLFKSAEDIETALRALDSTAKEQMLQSNQVTMRLGQAHEDRQLYAYSAQKGLEETIRHNNSIINKYRS